MNAAPPSLIHQRCLNHANREAAARCPSCSQYFCRECITEHEDRVICANCLGKLARSPLTQRASFQSAVLLLQFSTGFLVLWFLIYLFGLILISIPASFHEGSLWQTPWYDEP